MNFEKKTDRVLSLAIERTQRLLKKLPKVSIETLLVDDLTRNVFLQTLQREDPNLEYLSEATLIQALKSLQTK